VRRILVIALLSLAGATLLAPASAQAQIGPENLECAVNNLPLVGRLTGGGGLSDLLDLESQTEDLEECLGPVFEALSGNNPKFCDDCDPTFSYDKVADEIVKINGGLALRQRLIECRDRRLNQTHSDESRHDCGALERVFELYVNNENTLEARRRGDASPVTSNDANPDDSAAQAIAFEASSPQRIRRSITVRCGLPGGGVCRVDMIGRGALIASGQRAVAPGARATMQLRTTRRGQRLLRRVGRLRARVIVRRPGAFALERITLKR
jgi:hypothetical protein